MARLSLQHHILEDTVSVFIQPLPVGQPCLQHQLPLKDASLLRSGAHIVELIPSLHILRHRLAVEEDQGHPGLLRLVNENRRRGAVHDIDTQHIAAPGNQPVHLFQLGRLIAPSIGHREVDLDVPGQFLLLGDPLQVLYNGGDERVVLGIERQPHPQGLCFRSLFWAAARQRRYG